MRLQLERPELISLATGFTDNESLPVAETRTLLDQLLATPASGRPPLQYGTTAGLPDLRRLAAEHVGRLDARALLSEVSVPWLTAKVNSMSITAQRYSPERLLITHGSQQLLYLVTEALCDPGDIVLVEDPTYFVYLGIAQSHGLICRGTRLTPAGLDFDHLDQVLAELTKSGQIRRLKYFYTISYLQNPTGATLSLKDKSALAKRLRACEPAAGHPIYILEDAAYRELRFAGRDVPSMLFLPGTADRVIYAATFTKPFATGVRVGYGLLPAPLYEVVYRIKGNHDFGTSSLLQHLVMRALQSGDYKEHLGVLRQRYQAKAAIMVEAIRRAFPREVEWREPEGGLYVWARLPVKATGTNSRFFKTAFQNGVLYVPGELCYAPDPSRPRPGHEMRLSYGSATESDIREGIQRLGQALRSLSPAATPRRARPKGGSANAAPPRPHPARY
jgi:2-aminoadipate transaminase